MGSMHAAEMAENVNTGLITMEQAVEWHLQSNHYPPVPASMVPVCIRAINKARREEWDLMVRLPKGTTFRGSCYAPVYEVVKGHHLDCFI